VRFDGTIKVWHDDRGFGFIEPDQGGQDIFLHAKAYRGGGRRPEAGLRVSFTVELNRDGKKRAALAEPARVVRVPPKSRRAQAAQWGGASLFAVPGFAVLYLVVAAVWRVPHWAAGIYAVASLITFVAYAADKSAATRGGWRIAESTLLGLGLLGGWPGALLAQQVLRHKSVKASFRAAFWGSVVLNLLAFVLLASPVGRGFFLAAMAA
jgi:uncharacterized membrane protein YsdA (DUF1294 family)/cold shock CspA family protein